MKIKYEASFERDLKRIRDNELLKKIRNIIEEVKEADKPALINNLKKLKSHETFYRIRIGDYRIGIEIIQDEIIFTRILHRKEIYRYFP